MRVYQQNDGVEFDAWFESVPSAPTVPASVHWRLYCVTTDQVLQDWTTATYTIVSDESGAITGVYSRIDIDGALNGIQDTNNRRETKRLEVIAAKDTARQYSQFHEYAIANRSVR